MPRTPYGLRPRTPDAAASTRTPTYPTSHKPARCALSCVQRATRHLYLYIRRGPTGGWGEKRSFYEPMNLYFRESPECELRNYGVLRSWGMRKDRGYKTPVLGRGTT